LNKRMYCSIIRMEIVHFALFQIHSKIILGNE